MPLWNIEYLEDAEFDPVPPGGGEAISLQEAARRHTIALAAENARLHEQLAELLHEHAELTARYEALLSGLERLLTESGAQVLDKGGGRR